MSFTCNVCRRILQASEFYTDKHKAKGIRSECKQCSNRRTRAYQAAHPDEIKAWRRKHYHAKKSPAMSAVYRRNHLRRSYGLTEQQYQERGEAQEWICAICGNPETGKFRRLHPRQLSIDHDHSTGHLRGLLCCRCNLLVGRFERALYATDELSFKIREYLKMWCAKVAGA